MNFTDPKKTWDAVYAMVDASAPRARNRARINSVFNGDPPYTDQEAEENSIHTNVNFLEGTEIIHRARGQFTNAFMKTGRFFKVNLDIGPSWKRVEWGAIITQHINRAMKRSPRYFQSLKNQYAGVVLHGVGPVTWFRDKDWCPKAHGIDDIFVPTGTLCDFSNLEYFAVYTTFTMAELMKTRTGTRVDRGWNASLVSEALGWLAKESGKTGSSMDPNVFDHPEKIAEDFKENSGYYGSDATPVLRCYDFYYFDSESKSPGWRRKIILDQSNQQLAGRAAANDTILYDGKDKSYGEEVSQIFQSQFADGAVKAPFRYHSVRSLGFLLYAVCHLQNRLRGKFLDATFESLLWYFRNVTTGDEEKLAKIDLHHLGIIPEGLSWVPSNERPVIDPNLVGMAMSLNRQLIAEHSSSYVQDVEKANQSAEPTATEIMAKVNSSNALIGSMLNEAYTYEQYKQQEIARRFCYIDHKECKRVRELCQAEGVPAVVFQNFDAWEVVTERVLGGGNKILEIAQADKLMAIKDTAEVAPEARKIIDRIYILANTDNASLATDIIPMDEQKPSSAQQMATLAWGTLIDGKQVVISDPINPIDYIQTLIVMLGDDLQRIEGAGGNPPLDRVLGLANVIEHIVSKIQLVASAEALKPQVKEWMDNLKVAGNLVKAYMQRVQEAMQQQGQQGDPEAAAKIQALLISAESKARIMEDGAAQKRRHAEMKFVQDEKRKDDAAAAEIRRKALMTAVDIQTEKVKTKADIAMDREKTEAEIDASEKRTEAEIEAKDATTRAEIVRGNVAAANKPKPKSKSK